MSTAALRFPVNASRVTSANLSVHNFSEGITFEVWARREGNGNRGNRAIVISNGTWYLEFYDSSTFRISTNINNSQRSWDWGAMVPNHVWVHLALTYNRQTVRFYVNGEQVGSANISGPITRIGQQVIGGYSGGTDYTFIGSVKGLRVYNSVKTKEQIQHDKFLSMPTYSKGLILNHPLEEGKGDTVNDRSSFRQDGRVISCEWVQDGIYLKAPIELQLKANDIVVPRATDYPFKFQIVNNGVGQWATKEFTAHNPTQVGHLTLSEVDIEVSKWEKINELRVK